MNEEVIFDRIYRIENFFTATSLRQGYGGQEERIEHREKRYAQMKKTKHLEFDL